VYWPKGGKRGAFDPASDSGSLSGGAFGLAAVSPLDFVSCLAFWRVFSSREVSSSTLFSEKDLSL